MFVNKLVPETIPLSYPVRQQEEISGSQADGLLR